MTSTRKAKRSVRGGLQWQDVSVPKRNLLLAWQASFKMAKYYASPPKSLSFLAGIVIVLMGNGTGVGASDSHSMGSGSGSGVSASSF